MKHYSYPEEAVEQFSAVLDGLDSYEDAWIFDDLLEDYKQHRASLDSDTIGKLNSLAETLGCSEYTMHFVFLLSLAEKLKPNYELLGIPEKVYYDTMDDMRCKLYECMECKGVPGTFVIDWYDRFFRLELAAYGRFQYEARWYDGKLAVNIHIPSSGIPITDEVRLASYKEAYEHLHYLFPDGKVLFMCNSWLMFPDLKEFLPADMNIIKFQSDFRIVERHERDNFEDLWRIFGRYADLPYDKLPRDTKLRAAYADWLCSGHKGGDGVGLFVFDGEKIVG